MRKNQSLMILIIVLLLMTACGGPDSASIETFDEMADGIPPLPTNAQVDPGELGLIPEYALIMPGNFEYKGYFRLPGPSGGSDWDYSGHGLTYFPDGDPGSDGDGYPGSLFGFGHDHQLFVSEISIPEPVIGGALSEANSARTLQPFSNLAKGIFSAEEMTIPRAGLAYLGEPEPRLYFAFGQHIQDFEPSHGWASLNLKNPAPEGAWIFNGYTNYVTNDYLFTVPSEWALAIGSDPLIASGRAREGLWSGRGPGLFAYQPGDINNPPSAGFVLNSIYPLLLYGEQNSGQPDLISSPNQEVSDYHEADHWWGGAWLTSNGSAAVVLAGTKALGEEWYGFANGVVWEHDCAESKPPTCPDVPDWPYDNRGFWAENYQAQLIFFDPGQLISVARGEINSWEPQPYAILVLDDYLLVPFLNNDEYKRDLVGAAAYDRVNGFFYLVERLADEYRSVIHVWKIVP